MPKKKEQLEGKTKSTKKVEAELKEEKKVTKKSTLKKKSSKKTPAKKVKKKDEENLELEETQKEEKSKKAERRKILYIEIDDEVTTIFDRIKSVAQKNVFLVIPKRAIIFQSIINLKILKRKAEDMGKQLSIITSDENGAHLAGMIELPVFDSIHTNLTPRSASNESEEPDIAPLKAASNLVEEEAPTRLKERKLSISEFLHVFRKKNGIKSAPIRKKKSKGEKQKNADPKKSRFVFIAPSRQALIGLIVASLMIFLTITYIALPGSTIYLTPKSTVLEKSVNVSFADYKVNESVFDTHPENMIATYPVSETITKTVSQVTTGKVFKGTNASGFMTIVNDSNRPWPLVARTRFQNSEGIVFRIGSFVTVPANGNLKTPVVADENDVYGQIVGERGNTEPGNFFLPGLREENRLKLYGKNEDAMTGGTTDSVKIVNEQDLEAARNILSEELKKEAIDALKTKVIAQAQEQGSDARFELLVGDQALNFSEPRIDISDDLIGQQLDQFEVRGSVDLSGVYFNRDELVEILRNELMLKRSPEKKIVKINDESIVYSIFDENRARKTIRVTASIKGIEEYDIDPKRENGHRLTKIIKEHITGKKVSDAVDYIQNLPEVNKVKIENWPSWAPTIPSVADNIEIILAD